MISIIHLDPFGGIPILGNLHINWDDLSQVSWAGSIRNLQRGKEAVLKRPPEEAEAP